MLVWKDVHSIGNKELDEQHKFFFDIVNLLDECFDYKCAKEKLELFEKTLIEHFALEEDYMLKINFPNINSHKENHIQMMIEILEYSNNLQIENDEKYKMFIIKEFAVFIRDHIINHLLGDDIEIKIWHENNRGLDRNYFY